MKFITKKTYFDYMKRYCKKFLSLGSSESDKDSRQLIDEDNENQQLFWNGY